jgi:type IV pilus assembly protein PilV
VALAVLAFGVLGMAGLQTRTLMESRATNARAVAVRLAADLGERIRANPGRHRWGLSGSTSPYLMEWDTVPPVANCWTTRCSALELARFDLMQWRSSLSDGLPGGDARVFVAATDPSLIGVLIGWPPTAPPALAGTDDSTRPHTGPAYPLLTPAPGIGDVPCKPGLMCHLVFMRP